MTQRIIATPLARRLAKEKGVDLANIRGSGPNGRIVKTDLEGKNIKEGSAPSPVFQKPMGAGQITKIPLSGMRKTIAKRLSESKQQIPHFYLTVHCRIDELLKTRQQINKDAEEKKKGIKLSVNDFVIKAVAKAMEDVPAVNVTWEGEHMNQYSDIDISVAVAIPDGLITPIVRHANLKNVTQISHEVKELAIKAKSGKLSPSDYQGGTFTISNLGMYGIPQFNAIINPPQACILAVGAGEERPIANNGTVEIAQIMTCTLSVDHRAIDGAVGAEFIKVFQKYIENPALLLI